MLRNFPFNGDYPILQHFGENPGRYQTVSCGGVSLRGHDGIDYATPVGVQVVAVQSGAVMNCGVDPRFGAFVLLGHDWGQTLYAHLNECLVVQGQSVSAGQPVGVSGVSGAAERPHLHWGIRIHPFATNDGWCGYSDPQPYLDRLVTPRGPILGPHIIGGVHRHLGLLERWQPRLTLILDPNPDEVAELRAVCPNTVIIGRVFEPDHIVTERIRANPVAAAQWAHEKTLKRISPHIDYWQFANEVLQTGDGLPLLNEFELARMALAEESGYRCAILGFSVGNPDLPEMDRMAHWRMVYPAIERAETNDHIVAVHQYAAPTMTQPTLDWHIHRLEHQVLMRLPYKKVKFAVTEFGIDGLLLGPLPQGWRSFLDADEYVNQLERAARYLERFSGRVLGCAVFTYGGAGGWDNYDIQGKVAEALAERLDRGIWSDVNFESGGLAPGGDSTTAPGGSGAPAQPPPPAEPPVAPLPEPPPPLPPTEPPGGGTETPPRRVSDWIARFNMSIREVDQRPDHPQGNIVYRIKDVFTTRNGSWETGGEAGDIPQWARDAYLSSDFTEADANRNLFAAVLDLDGQLVKDQEIRFWSDGFERLADPSYDGYVVERTKQGSGWANITLFGSSVYAPERGEAGPWCWTPLGAADVLCGGGLPSGKAISTFVVWQATTQATPSPEPPIAPPGEPPVTPPTPPPSEAPTAVQRRKGGWVDYLNVKVRSIAERPDHPQPQDDVIYVIKDIFTTRDGSWEMSEILGSVDQWARDTYLKPFGAPDYFDDAGADHHIFAAVIGLDGELLRDWEIVFWSDGFDKLGDPSYTGYVQRLTKTQSGWANIPLDPGSNYVPERGEAGPWCWAPKGAAEVISGGGMPAKQHISFFVVWQAVKSSAVQPPKPPSGDFNIFLPIVTGGRPAAAPDASLSFGPSLVETPPLAVRAGAWNRLGLEFDAGSPLAEYARRQNLGAPLTNIFEAEGFIAQGFQLGVVYAPKNEPQTVLHMDW
jgi:hypothetical protein